MLLDVLDVFETVKVCTAYEIDGVRHTIIPSNNELLARAAPVFEELAGWQCDISDVRAYEELPEAARAYIARIEEFSGVSVSLVSVGAGREQTIRRGTL